MSNQNAELIHTIPMNQDDNNDELCPRCGANLKVWLEMFGEVHYCDQDWEKGRVVK